MPADSRTASALRDACAVTLVVGSSFVAMGVARLTVLNACVVDPACLPDAAGL